MNSDGTSLTSKVIEVFRPHKQTDYHYSRALVINLQWGGLPRHPLTVVLEHLLYAIIACIVISVYCIVYCVYWAVRKSLRSPQIFFAGSAFTLSMRLCCCKQIWSPIWSIQLHEYLLDQWTEW